MTTDLTDIILNCFAECREIAETNNIDTSVVIDDWFVNYHCHVLNNGSYRHEQNEYYFKMRDRYNWVMEQIHKKNINGGYKNV